MRIVLQRVLAASVEVEGATCGEIGRGLLVLLGVSRADSEKDIDYLVEKTLGLRIFPDQEGKMNLSVSETGGELLIVSQFTLYGDCRKGRRPSFDQAAPPELARSLYERFVEKAAARGIRVATGIFQADMKVSLVNDGPVTLVYDSEKQI
ncbi:MAG: D-aminoacyl-tRNA deacylase [Bryobacter sp.]|jgi:D-tyrosyl-tRNA(Tyr) deacylase|nr:D-aminoacyl-tRNA deacylase [Bryobacter sp.]